MNALPAHYDPTNKSPGHWRRPGHGGLLGRDAVRPFFRRSRFNGLFRFAGWVDHHVHRLADIRGKLLRHPQRFRQPAAAILLEKVAHHRATGCDMGLEPDEPRPPNASDA